MDGLSDLALSDFFAPFPAALLALSLRHKKLKLVLQYEEILRALVRE